MNFVSILNLCCSCDQCFTMVVNISNLTLLYLDWGQGTDLHTWSWVHFQNPHIKSWVQPQHPTIYIHGLESIFKTHIQNLESNPNIQPSEWDCPTQTKILGSFAATTWDSNWKKWNTCLFCNLLTKNVNPHIAHLTSKIFVCSSILLGVLGQLLFSIFCAFYFWYFFIQVKAHVYSDNDQFLICSLDSFFLKWAPEYKQMVLVSLPVNGLQMTRKCETATVAISHFCTAPTYAGLCSQNAQTFNR